MKAEELRKGDFLPDEYNPGKVAYTVVEDARIAEKEVVVTVQYRDGGTGYRAWDVGTEVPDLVRPEKEGLESVRKGKENDHTDH